MGDIGHNDTRTRNTQMHHQLSQKGDSTELRTSQPSGDLSDGGRSRARDLANHITKLAQVDGLHSSGTGGPGSATVTCTGSYSIR